ncbi:MAG: hypothetical protein ACYTDT_03935 [Planctomycetota bacterium]|jgi:hypothetical protein
MCCRCFSTRRVFALGLFGLPIAVIGIHHQSPIAVLAGLMMSIPMLMWTGLVLLRISMWLFMALLSIPLTPFRKSFAPGLIADENGLSIHGHAVYGYLENANGYWFIARNAKHRFELYESRRHLFCTGKFFAQLAEHNIPTIKWDGNRLRKAVVSWGEDSDMLQRIQAAGLLNASLPFESESSFARATTDMNEQLIEDLWTKFPKDRQVILMLVSARNL